MQAVLRLVEHHALRAVDHLIRHFLAAMTKRVRTSRAALDRLLEADIASVTLQTMGRAAVVLDKELSITLKDAA